MTTPQTTAPSPASSSASASAPAPALTIAGLEDVYDALATAIDQVGPEKSKLFLVKLALLNANALANPQTFKDHIAAALRDV